MDPSGNMRRHAPDDAPVFFTMTQQKGKGSSKERSAWKKSEGKADDLPLKGKVRRWGGVGEQGKASKKEEGHPLQNTMEQYAKERIGFHALERRKRKRKQSRRVQKVHVVTRGDIAEIPDRKKEKGKEVMEDWSRFRRGGSIHFTAKKSC